MTCILVASQTISWMYLHPPAFSTYEAKALRDKKDEHKQFFIICQIEHEDRLRYVPLADTPVCDWTEFGSVVVARHGWWAPVWLVSHFAKLSASRTGEINANMMTSAIIIVVDTAALARETRQSHACAWAILQRFSMHILEGWSVADQTSSRENEKSFTHHRGLRGVVIFWFCNSHTS